MHSDALAGFDVRGPARSPANTVTVTGSAVPPGGGGELFLRAVGNPLLTARRWPDPVNAVLNPGAALVDGVTVLLCRVEDRRGISQLTVARSADGVSNWVIDPARCCPRPRGTRRRPGGWRTRGSPGSTNWTAG